jgi:hypothetical protein
VLAGRGGLPYSCKVSNEFLSDHAPDKAGRLLENWDLAGQLIAAGSRRLVVTNRGVGGDA